MAEVSNQKILERYMDLLSNRTHDVIVRDLALDVLEEELRDVKDENNKLNERVETLKQSLNRANDVIARMTEKPSAPTVIEGEVVTD